jgi:hypothetical protein
MACGLLHGQRGGIFLRWLLARTVTKRTVQAPPTAGGSFLPGFLIGYSAALTAVFFWNPPLSTPFGLGDHRIRSGAERRYSPSFSAGKE